uniref:Uncharacterized protein n=1 Tax=Anguilla anguilla TaxID=7936 RepID=A0A0E9QJW3_ANGAN
MSLKKRHIYPSHNHKSFIQLTYSAKADKKTRSFPITTHLL